MARNQVRIVSVVDMHGYFLEMRDLDDLEDLVVALVIRWATWA